MFHTKRKWSVGQAESVEDLADKLSGGRTWTSCTAFRLAGYLFVNDQTCEDGAGEWGVLSAANVRVQVESITFSWCDREQALRYIQQCLGGECDMQAWASGVVPDQFDESKAHRCGLCA